MQGNLTWEPATDKKPLQVRVVDESLINYGFQKGDVLDLGVGVADLDPLPVWELDGQLHARIIEDQGGGWAVAFTTFLTAGKICHSLSPEQIARVRRVGWIQRVEKGG